MTTTQLRNTEYSHNASLNHGVWHDHYTILKYEILYNIENYKITGIET